MAIEKYRRKISGPVADRIDLWVQVGELPPETFAQKRGERPSESNAVRERVVKARTIQRERFTESKDISTNADMGPKEIEHLALLNVDAEKALIGAARTLKLSPRGYHRTIKIARTIADLAQSTTIETAHMLEALQYRSREV